MWLKGGFGGAHLDYLLSMAFYAVEAKFYLDLQPQIGVGAPTCFGGAYDMKTGQGIVLIEDLAPPRYVFPGFKTPLSPDLVSDGLKELAQLHGRSWAQPWLDQHELNCMMGHGSAQERYFRTYDIAHIDRYLNGPVGKVAPPEVRNAESIYEMFWALQPHYHKGPITLLHGDASAGNCVIEHSKKVCFLDWQVIAKGPWAHDFAYWVASSLSIEDRRQHEVALLRHYLDHLKGYGVEAPTWEEAWLDYRRFIAWGFFVWMRVPQSMQPVEHLISFGARFSQAAMDHDVFGLLGVKG